MLSIDVGKVSRHPAPAGPVGDDAIPQAAQQPPGLIPGILTMYPGCTPRPRNKRAWDAACAAAQGEPVQEFDASGVTPGMRAWCGSSFLAVVDAWHMHLGDIKSLENQITSQAATHPFVLLRLEGNGCVTGWIIGELDTPVYVLAPTPDAATASGAGTSVQKPTAAQR